MPNHSRLCSRIILSCLLSAAAPAVHGQDIFDFDANVRDEQPTAEPAATPTAQPAPSQPAPSAAQPAAPAPPPGTTAAVEAIRATDPRTPADLLRAVDQLVQLQRSDIAAEYLDRLVKLSLNDAALAELYDQFGTAVMIRLSRARELQPQAHELAASIMAAGRRMLADPGRLAGWVQQLGADDRTARLLAARQLLQAGTASVPMLVDAMSAADAAEGPLRDWGLAVLQRLGIEALDPLYGYLSSDDVARREATLLALGRIAAPDSLPYLVAPLFAPVAGQREAQAAADAWSRIVGGLPDRSEAQQLLAVEAERAYRGDPGTAVDPDDQAVGWIWDAEQRRPVATDMSGSDAAALKSSRLYDALLRLDPDDVRAAHRYLVSRLQVEQALVGLDQPLPRGPATAFAAARQAGSARVSQVLSLAMDGAHDAAAMAAAQVLADLADPTVLQRGGAENSPLAAPLVMALSYPDRRVRFAAAQAIAAISRRESYDGTGRLVDVLQYFATSRGQRVVVIAHPNPTLARDLAGMLASRGFRPAVVTTARELMKVATSSADVELVMVSDALNRDSLWSTLEALHAHPKTARLPIAVLTRPAARDDAVQIADRRPNVLVVPERMDEQTLNLRLPQLLATAGRSATTPERRAEQARAATALVKELSGQ